MDKREKPAMQIKASDGEILITLSNEQLASILKWALQQAEMWETATNETCPVHDDSPPNPPSLHICE